MRLWWPALAWAGFIFVLSSIPGNDFPEVPGPQTDKLVHAILYGVLGVFSGRALAAGRALTTARLVGATCLMAVAYGTTDELHQLLTPRRSCDWHDVVADAVGGLLGGLVAAAIVRRRRADRRGKDGAAV
jgi:VanZ family protein